MAAVTLRKASDVVNSALNLALINVPVTPLVASRLHVPNPSTTHGVSLDKIDYSDGYGYEYAVGE